MRGEIPVQNAFVWMEEFRRAEVRIRRVALMRTVERRIAIGQE